MQEKNTDSKPHVLIITTICGGGHMQAANALKKKILASEPEAKILQIDLFNDWMGKLVGGFLTRRWNAPLRKGHNFFSLCYSYFGIPLADPFFFIPLFIKAFKTFQTVPITRVIDTQPVGNSAIALALLISNKLQKKNLFIEKILTEIPTKQAIHFFHPLKLMPNPLRKLIQLYVVEPLPKESNFWENHTGLLKNQIKVIDPPLRESFFKLDNDKNSSRIFPISFPTEEEKKEILKIGKLYPFVKNETYRSLYVDCTHHARVTTIMLGSQPRTLTFEKYIEKFISISKKNKKKTYFIFILGNSGIEGWTEFKENLIKLKDLPTNLHPIILSTQDQKTVAMLLKYSDSTITRSGGLTSMELLKVEQRNAKIHTEILKKGKPALKKMPPWEVGNAKVLMHRLGAKVVHPDVLTSLE